MHETGLVKARLALLLLVAACTSHASSGPKATSTTPTLPVVKESFTPVPCDDSTNVGEEGCLEKQVLDADAQVNALVKAQWDKADAQDRALLFKGESAWLAFRQSFCAWSADQVRGGTAGPVVAAQCAADLTAQHLKDLRAQIQTG